jgi:PAS domain S-box-containing protein
MNKILFVDDKEENLYFLKIVFEKNGFEVTSAKNGIEALEAAHTNTQDIVISDILMPGMDGFSLCRQWKTDDQLKDIPFIFYTATYTDVRDEEFALSLGAERFIRKPAEPDELVKAIKEVLAQHQRIKGSEGTPSALEEETVYYKKYNEALIRKMEDKMLELEKVNLRLTALFQASVDLAATMPERDFVAHILNKVINVLDGYLANYFEFDEVKQEFRLQALVGFPDSDLKKYQKILVFHLGEERGLIGLAGKTREVIIINDTRQDPRWINANNDIRSAVFFPMVCKNRLIGVLCILSKETNAFDQKFSRDMATLANNLAIAIDRARFFREIQQSEYRYRTLVETSIDAIVSIDEEGLITDWSIGAMEIFGYKSKERIGKPIEDMVPKENLKEVTEVLKETREQGFKRIWETQLRAKNKQILDVEMTITYLGTDLGYTTIIRNVTEQKKNEEALLESEKFLNSIIENIPNMLFVKDAKELRFVRFNKAGEDLLGYSRQDMRGKSDFDFFSKEEAEVFFKNDQEALKKNILIDIHEEKINTKEKGERILHTRKIPILDEQGKPKYLLGISEDITKQKRSEQLLNALNQAAVLMATALTPLDIFTTVACELRKLDLTCLLLPIEDIQTKLFSTYLDCDAVSTAKSKESSDVIYEDFSVPIDAVDSFKKAVFEKKSIFVGNSDEILAQILPKYSKKISKKFTSHFSGSKILVTPLVTEDKVIGIFLVQSDNLTPEDTPAVTAFANQLAAAWNKAKLTTKLQHTIGGIIQTIALIVESRDPYTAGHQKRVSSLAAAIAAEMQLPPETVEGVRIASLIHDLGKIHIPAEILSKPGKLTPLEYDLVKIHPQVGFDLLKNIDFPWPIARVIYQHHERINGTGYPQGLKGEEIMIESRILSVADVIEAMSSHRPYRPALGFAAAKDEVVRKRSEIYDSDVVDACIKVFEKGFKFPTD